MDISDDVVKMPTPVGPVPIALDGGWGWIVVLGAFLSYFIADGWAYSFGIIYPNLLQHFHESKGKTAIIGALLYGMPLIISPLVCACTTVYGCRRVTIVGGVLTGLSFIVSAFATSVDFLCFSTGILASFGLAMTYIPALVIVTYYFEKRRGLATGLAVTGSGLGAFAFPPLLEKMLNYYNWRGALIVLGGICFNIIVAGLLFRPPPMTTDHLEGNRSGPNTPKHRKHVRKSGNILMPRLHEENSSLRNRSQSTGILDTTEKEEGPTTLSLSTCLSSARRDDDPEHVHLLSASGPSPLSGDKATSSPELYMASAAPTSQDEGPAPSALKRSLIETKLVVTSMLDRSLLQNWPYLIYCAHNFILFLWVGVPYVYLVDKSILLGIDAVKAAFLLSIIGIARTFGQLILGFIGDLPRVSTVTLYATAITITGVVTVLLPVYKSYWMLCLYSTLFGFFVSVTYSLQMMCVVDLVGIHKSTNGFGLMQLCQGISTLLGTPVAGWLFDATGMYDPSFYTAGGFIIVSGLMLIPVPFMLRSRNQAQSTSIEDHTAV